jgi:hypothetical protein
VYYWLILKKLEGFLLDVPIQVSKSRMAT